MNFTLLNSASSQEQDHMAKEWENAETMEDNVNGLHLGIHSLAQTLGLNPVLLIMFVSVGQLELRVPGL